MIRSGIATKVCHAKVPVASGLFTCQPYEESVEHSQKYN